MELLIETFCLLDGEILNLPYHQERIIRSVGRELPMGAFVQAITQESEKLGASTGKWRASVTYFTSGVVGIKLIPYSIADIKGLRLTPIPHNFYSRKWADRSTLDSYKKVLPRGIEPLFVLNHQLTDTSFTNILLEKDGQLYTPSSPLLQGTKRSQLLHKRLITEAPIIDLEMSSYTAIHLINAMLDPGDLVLPISAIAT